MSKQLFQEVREVESLEILPIPPTEYLIIYSPTNNTKNETTRPKGIKP